LFSIGIFVGIFITKYSLSTLKKDSEVSRGPISEYEQKIYELVESTRDMIYYFETKPKRRFRYTRPPIEKVFKVDSDIDPYENPHILRDQVHPDDLIKVDKKIVGEVDFNNPILYRLRNHEGEFIWYEEYLTPVYENGEMVAIIGILRNVHEKLKLQEELEYRITHDALTDVYNREFFEKIMEKYNLEVDIPIGIILCDLDNLKRMNDTLGHKKGDEYIKTAAQILNRFSSEEILVSRIGGDEFAIIIVNHDKSEVAKLSGEISKEIQIYNTDNPNFLIEMSIGYAHSNQSLSKMEDMFTEADKKMYIEKQAKKVVNV
jgi:diguanylate cyclase (GGDEF)-like protein